MGPGPMQEAAEAALASRDVLLSATLKPRPLRCDAVQPGLSIIEAMDDPSVISGVQATNAANSTAVSALAQQYGGTLTFTRGVASAPIPV